MKKQIVVLGVCSIFMLLTSGYAQQLDISFGGGSVAAPTNLNTFSGVSQSIGGGAYFGFGGDVLIKRNIGFGAEVFWRGSQGVYAGQIPYRPVFWSFNGVWGPKFSPRFGAEVVAGVGAESLRFYQGVSNCDYYGNCSNYVSSNHFMGDFGGGLKLYAWKSLFVRPEVRLYLVHNNVEFASGTAVRYGASIGYTFGGGSR